MGSVRRGRHGSPAVPGAHGWPEGAQQRRRWQRQAAALAAGQPGCYPQVMSSAPTPSSPQDLDEEIPAHHELIDGELIEKETSGEHARAQASLTSHLWGPYNRRPGGRLPGGWWFATEAVIDFSGQKLRPDVAGWRRERAQTPPSGAVVRVIPDWICEVLSPGNASNDTIKKMRIYHAARVGHYWLLDPRCETLQVYRWHADGYLFVLGATRTERVRAEPFSEIETPVGVFFGDDEDDPDRGA